MMEITEENLMARMQPKQSRYENPNALDVYTLDEETRKKTPKFQVRNYSF